uniref:Uncharacterized protein n=1 Tax=Glossina pallidipes TaxID=7398 RepID=A0A1A9ZX46_GLOPL
MYSSEIYCTDTLTLRCYTLSCTYGTLAYLVVSDKFLFFYSLIQMLLQIIIHWSLSGLTYLTYTISNHGNNTAIVNVTLEQSRLKSADNTSNAVTFPILGHILIET